MADKLVLERERLDSLFDNFLEQISPSVLFSDKEKSNYRYHRKYNKKGAKLRGFWEAYHFIDFVKHLIEDKNLEKFTIENLNTALHGRGLGTFEDIRFAPTRSRGFSNSNKAKESNKGRKVFKVVADVLGVHYLECYAQFLEFCAGKLPLIEYDDDIHSETLISDINAIRRYLKTLEEKENPQPKLAIPEINKESIFHYTQQEVKEPLGRKTEQDQLRDFTQHNNNTENIDSGFFWLQLAGDAGQGKSRLAFELMLEVSDTKAWAVGQFSRTQYYEFVDLQNGDWNIWQPDKPHLFVVDYVIGEHDWLSPFFHALSARDDFKPRVCVLLIERQRWDKGGFIRPKFPKESDNKNNQPFNSILSRLDTFSSDPYAHWFLSIVQPIQCDIEKFTDRMLEKFYLPNGGIIELNALDDIHLFEIVENITQKYGLKLSQRMVLDKLEALDRLKRPLIAYFYAYMLVHSHDAAEQINSLDELLRCTLKRHRELRCESFFRSDEKKSFAYHKLAKRLAVIATVTGGLDIQELRKGGLLANENIDENCKLHAMLYTDTPVRTDEADSFGNIILPLQLDLLAEWMVIDSLSEDFTLTEVMDIAWKYNPGQTVTFLVKIVQDFPEYFMTHEILAHPLPDNNCMDYLSRESTTIWMHLNHHTQQFPSQLVKAIEYAAEHYHYAVSELNLAVHYEFFSSHELSPELAFKYYKRAADKGCNVALLALGSCYLNAIGTAHSHKLAYESFYSSATKGNSEALNNLGYCHLYGIGIYPDEKYAVEIFKDAASKGCDSARINLGLYYINSDALADQKYAYENFKIAANSGHPEAINNLAYCYQYGIGVERNEELAYTYYKVSADLGNSTGLSSLGYCYVTGLGVDPDLEIAIDLFQQSISQGYVESKPLLLNLRMVNCILNRSQEQIQTTHSKGWANAQLEDFGKTWKDSPPIDGSWKNCSVNDSLRLLTLIEQSINEYQFYPDISNLVCENIRLLPIDFYPDCILIDIQIFLKKENKSILTSAIIKGNAIAFLNVDCSLIHILNLFSLSLSDPESTISYLQFYLSFVAAEHGPFRFISDITDVPYIMEFCSLEHVMALTKLISKTTYIDGEFNSDGFMRFSGFYLSASMSIFVAEFLVSKSGAINITQYKCLIENVYSSHREYYRFHREPLRKIESDTNGLN